MSRQNTYIHAFYLEFSLRQEGARTTSKKNCDLSTLPMVPSPLPLVPPSCIWHLIKLADTFTQSDVQNVHVENTAAFQGSEVDSLISISVVESRNCLHLPGTA